MDNLLRDREGWKDTKATTLHCLPENSRVPFAQLCWVECLDRRLCGPGQMWLHCDSLSNCQPGLLGTPYSMLWVAWAEQQRKPAEDPPSKYEDKSLTSILLGLNDFWWHKLPLVSRKHLYNFLVSSSVVLWKTIALGKHSSWKEHSH